MIDHQHPHTVFAVVAPGRQLASGLTKLSYYPRGTIAMQAGMFARAGVDITGLHSATINLTLPDDKVLLPTRPAFVVRGEWFPGKDETFILHPVILHHSAQRFSGWIYQPSWASKSLGAPTPTEVIMPLIDGVRYGDPVRLVVDRTVELVTMEAARDFALSRGWIGKSLPHLEAVELCLSAAGGRWGDIPAETAKKVLADPEAPSRLRSLALALRAAA